MRTVLSSVPSKINTWPMNKCVVISMEVISIHLVVSSTGLFPTSIIMLHMHDHQMVRKYVAI